MISVQHLLKIDEINHMITVTGFIIPGIIINKCATLHNTYSCKKYNKSKIDLKLIYIEFIPSCF